MVEDEVPLRETVSYNLEREGFAVLAVPDVPDCLRAVREHRVALILLDIMLPSGSGLDVCRVLRARSQVPIIMLTALASPADRVRGLDMGADDYVAKPFEMRELLARVRSVLRRASPATADRKPVVQAGDLRMDVERHEAYLGDRALSLSPREYELLLFMMERPGRVFSRQVLLDRVWDAASEIEERTVDVHIRWLREKIEQEPSNPRRLLTVRGVGYKFQG